MALSNNAEWMSTSRLRDAPSAPAVTALPSSAARGGEDGRGASPAANGEDSLSKAAVAVGALVIGALVGSTLWRARRQSRVQTLYPGGLLGDRGHDGDRTSRNAKCIAFVNLPPKEQAMASAAMKQWFPSEDGALTLRFDSVTFFDEVGDDTVGGVHDSVRHAALTAFRELRTRIPDLSCVAVHRSAVTVDHEVVELRESNAQTLRRADTKALRVCHGVGFTVDGEGAEALLYDVVGTVDASLASAVWTDPSDMERLGVVEVLQRCCVATRETLCRYKLADRTHRIFGLESVGAREATTTSASVDQALTGMVGNGNRLAVPVEARRAADETVSWRSAFFLFCDFAAVLRMSAEEFDGVARLLVKQPEQGTFLGSALMKSVWRRLRSVFARRARGAPADTGGLSPDGTTADELLRLPLSAHYCIGLRVRGVVDRTVEALLAALVTALVEHTLGKPALHRGPRGVNHPSPALLTAVPREGAETCVLVDLADAQSLCSALQAHRIAMHTASLMLAIGLPLHSYSIVAESPSEELRGSLLPVDCRSRTLRLPAAAAAASDAGRRAKYEALSEYVCGRPECVVETPGEAADCEEWYLLATLSLSTA